MNAGGKVLAVIWYSQGYPTKIHLTTSIAQGRGICGVKLNRKARVLNAEDDQTRGRCGPCDDVARRFQLVVVNERKAAK